MDTNKWCENEIRELIADVSKANTVAEVEDIFDLVLTPRELNDMAKRHKIKKMLEAGEPYINIETSLKVSPTIISKVSSHIGYGFRRRYANVGNKESQFAKRPKKFKELSITSIKRFWRP
jgi:uncharacterized protein YerC